jgi:hypothetical protein
MLDYYGRVSNKTPKLVGLQTRISLEVIKEGVFVGIIVGIYNPLLSAYNILDFSLCSHQGTYSFA